MLEGLSNFATLMKNAKELHQRAQGVKDRLAEERVDGVAGGGMVRVTATGDQRIAAIAIEPQLISGGDKEFLEDLLLAATNQALDHARELASKEMSALTDGMDFPGFQEALRRMGLGG